VSIYCTLWEIKLPRRHCFDNEWVMVYAQAVPPHIGHPSVYPDGDPYADFLPPVVQDYRPSSGTVSFNRAVVIVQEGRDSKDVQRYTDPLIVMTGEEYARIPFQELLDRIQKAMGWDDSVIAMHLLPDGQKKIIRVQGDRETEEGSL
jgi:hypothetical protein